MVQQMILFAFSAFGLTVNPNFSSKPWYLDSGASNHMTNYFVSLSNVPNLIGNQKIHTADGNSLPINAIGDISHSLTNVLVSPNLSTNLISIGQLVDHDYNVQFSRYGCIVQDQVSGKIILKGPKAGRLFPLHLSSSTICPTFPLLSLVCIDDRQINKMWHNHLGHPNSYVLSTLLKSGSLGNKNFFCSF